MIRAARPVSEGQPHRRSEGRVRIAEVGTLSGWPRKSSCELTKWTLRDTLEHQLETAAQHGYGPPVDDVEGGSPRTRSTTAVR